ncbi:restriction endonuclease [Roseibium sp.]|uniref:restriction endonuclease n=1 Tax=Roseibium sp. TaxID=1936156 RepID=UPI003A97DBF4
MNTTQRVSKRWTDAALQLQICSLEQTIEQWAVEHDLWFDCGFTSYSAHNGGEPGAPAVVTVLCLGGGLHRVLSGEDGEGYEPAFTRLVDGIGYEYENFDGVTIHFYPKNPDLAAAFEDYFHWQWVCSLITDDTADIYHELYEQFAAHPDRLQRLHWREFEILLFRLFQNQGFETLLGPGQGDEGVDLRLVQRSPLGDVLTFVQAKRYRADRPVKLPEVQALYGAAQLDHADNALFVTTSDYAPAPKRWAARSDGFIQLAAADEVVKWCAGAKAGVILDRASLVARDRVDGLIHAAAQGARGLVVHASGGWNITDNWFALVLKETKHAALLMGVPAVVFDHDGYGQIGRHVPKLDPTTIDLFRSENVWRATRSNDNGRIRYWDGRKLYFTWDGQPCDFNLLD